MADLKYETKNISSPQGKQRVYFCCHPDDLDLYFNSICEDIFKYVDCAIWYKEDPVAKWDKEEMELELGQMQLFVIPVTSKFLDQENDARCIELPFALAQNIPILPLAQEEGLEQKFNDRCCPRQCFCKKANDKNKTGISYDEKIKNYLCDVLLSSELEAEVRKAFDAYIFMSYRKKDRAYAQELMKMIHQNDFCRDIAIWYDEFLTPEEDFNDMIKEAMDKSSLVTFAVTPNLLESGNYVMDHEYKDAQKSGKPILPVEMVPMDKELLENSDYLKKPDFIEEEDQSQLSDEEFKEVLDKNGYPGMPDLVDSKDKTQFSDALMKEIKSLNLPENDQDPEHLYLIGLAYLKGIDVETDYNRAIQLLRMSAEKGNVNAQIQMGDCYNYGIGLEEDTEKAIEWYKKAAKQGNSEALFKLGNCYWDLGEEDTGKYDNWAVYLNGAFQCYQKAAEQGHKFAQYNLGLCYEEAKGVPSNDEKAIEWYTKAAEQGLVCAMSHLGDIYRNGTYYGRFDDNFVPDYEKAIFWYRKAAENGDAEAQRAMGDLCRDGQGCEQEFEQAVIWYRKAAEQGDVLALRDLCRLYQKGYGTDQDYEQVVWHYKNGASHENPWSMYDLGYIYEMGLGVPQDPAKAFQLYNSAYETITEMAKEDKDYARYYMQLAADLANTIADCYYNGRCVPQSYEQFVAWYKKVEKEWGLSHFVPYFVVKVGDCYYNGQGVPQDPAKAVECYKKAAESHDDDAMGKLGDCYANGTGVERDLTEARYWYDKRKKELEIEDQPVDITKEDDREIFEQYKEDAEQGDASAQFQLGSIYEEGSLVISQDYDQAVYWYTKAADQEYLPAQAYLGQLYKYGSMYSHDFPCDNDKAFYWYQKAADNGDAESQYELGLCYGLGEGAPCNFKQAFYWFKKAAEQGYADAQDLLGAHYENGRGVEQNYDLAVCWYTKAADQGYLPAQTHLGRLYMYGPESHRNNDKAVNWYQKAADNGDAESQCELGLCYTLGKGEPCDFEQAFSWFKKAADQGYADAQSLLGSCYEIGRGVEQNYEQAAFWYTKAAEQGDEDANKALDAMIKKGLI